MTFLKQWCKYLSGLLLTFAVSQRDTMEKGLINSRNLTGVLAVTAISVLLLGKIKYNDIGHGQWRIQRGLKGRTDAPSFH